ncbi:ThiF family adenylyltransferase [Microbacterium sp. X-17]|uniref:ThiF family adenylyltransferase n=1 Tax=Microbacterium sp. X-17 TaxID=3144404 RepID=UPI0031F4B2AA
MPFPPLVEPVPVLSAHERARTTRHAILAGLGEIGQRRIAAAHVVVIGAGGLGSPAILALAAAGIGTLTVIDDDEVELTNLQRQVLHRHADLGAPKVDSAVRAAADLAPETRVRPLRVRLTEENATDLLRGSHVVIDGSDTFDTRGAVAAACEELGVPLVWGTVQGFDAQVTVFWSAPPADAAPVVLADLYPPETVGEVPSCAEVGVLGALCLQVGALLATQAIALVAGIGEPLLGRVLVIDGLRARQTEVPLRPAHPGPGHPLAENALVSRKRDVFVTQARSHPGGGPVTELSAAEAAAAREAGITVVDVREPSETAMGIIPGARLLPLAELLDRPEAVGPGPVLVVCLSGARATRAARALRDAGVEASVLAGGMRAWDAAAEPA